jgi:3-methyladenine DNA glycosylase AlkC
LQRTGKVEEEFMGKTEVYAAELEELVWDPKQADELAEKLMAESNLPGPRGNLELAEAFAKAVSTAAAEPAAWLETLYDWAGISAEEAPTGDPREFLPFCALLSFGVLYNTHACSYPCTGPCDCPLWPVQSEHLVEMIRRAAADPRWRIREAVAMSLQHLGGGNPSALRRILDDWLSDGVAKAGCLTDSSLMERRAVLAALAHPPLLGETDFARYALKTAGGILEDAAGVPAERRKGEAFQILKKGLSYALSVFVAHLPEEGFSLLERWAESSDPDVRRVLVENLKKKRLKAVDPDRLAGLLRTLGG